MIFVSDFLEWKKSLKNEVGDFEKCLYSGTFWPGSFESDFGDLSPQKMAKYPH